jgi:hypothetical protein
MSARCTGGSPQASSLTRNWKAMPASSRSATCARTSFRSTMQRAESSGRSSGSSFTVNGAAEVFDDDGGARFVWTTDLLTDELAGNVEAMMDAGIGAIKKTIESG